MAYDITNAESFQKAKHWVSELQKNASGAIGEPSPCAADDPLRYQVAAICGKYLQQGMLFGLAVDRSAI